jgi:hypothetical protein
MMHSIREEFARFAYVTRLRVEGNQTRVLCKPKASLTEELGELKRTAAGKLCL